MPVSHFFTLNYLRETTEFEALFRDVPTRPGMCARQDAGLTAFLIERRRERVRENTVLEPASEG